MSDTLTPQSSAPVSLTDRTSRAALWVSGHAMLVRIAALLTQVVLARLLLTEDFGLYALAMTVFSFASLMHQGGIQDVLINRQRSFQLWSNSAFWLSLTTGVIASALMICAAPLAARFYETTRPRELTWMIIVLSAVLPITSAGGVSRARLQIDMRFKAFAFAGMAFTLLDAALKVLLAWLGFGAQSFVYALVASSIFYLLACWWLAPVRVKLNPQFRRWKYLIRDGSLIVGAGFFYWLIEEGDYIVLGRLEREEVVGLYFLAYKISRQSMMALTFNLSKVLFPALSRLPEELGRRTQAFVRAARMLALLSTYLCVVTAVVADPLVRLLFTPNWHDVIPLIQIMCIGMSLRTLSWPSVSLLQAQGRFHTRMLLSIVSVLVFFPATIAGTWYGSALGLSIAVASFHSFIAVVDLATALWPSRRPFHLIVEIFRVPVVANTACVGPAMVVAYWIVPRLGVPFPWMYVLQILTALLASSLVYASVVRRIDAELWRDTVDRIGRTLGWRRKQVKLDSSSPV